MEENKQNQPQAGPPPPPAPEIKMRTMESDVKSIEESGGGIPEPKLIKPNELDQGGPVFKPETQTEDKSDLTTPIELPPIEESSLSKSSSAVRPWIWWLLVGVIVVVALFLSVYYYIWPLLFTPATTEPVEEAVVEETLPVENTPVVVHQSFFNFSDNEISKTTVNDYSVISILTALQDVSTPIGQDDTVKEVTLEMDGEPVLFKNLLSTLLPEISGSNLQTTLDVAFNSDFTSYLYYQDGKAWPGYVAKLKSDIDVDRLSLLSHLSELEDASVNNLFLSPPGEPTESFKTGPVRERYTSRYISYPQKPASFNYGMFGDYLIISTTYKGLLKAVDLLGL